MVKFAVLGKPRQQMVRFLQDIYIKQPYKYPKP
jgi:hypothetical protein